MIYFFSAYYMAVGGVKQNTKEKKYSLLSPQVNVSENTCLAFEIYLVWKKNNKAFGLWLKIDSTSETGVVKHVLQVF